MGNRIKSHESRVKISGTVIRGDGYGHVLGFPTANLDRRGYSRRKMKVRLGIYAGSAVVGPAIGRHNLMYPAAIVIGPMDKSGLPKIEAHLINYKGNLYGKKLSLYLGIYLRPFKKFKNEKALKLQIAKDIKQAKKYGNPGSAKASQ